MRSTRRPSGVQRATVSIVFNQSIEIPKSNIGDWILWKNMGAYTISGAVQFNGLPFGKPLYFMSKPFWYVPIELDESKNEPCASLSLSRDTVKAAFQPVARKVQLDAHYLRLNSSDCSNEIEDDMLPWLLEDIAEDTSVVTIQ